MEKLTECGHSCPQKPTECGFSNPPADKNSPEGAHMVSTPFNRGSENPHSDFFSPYVDIDMRKRYHLPHWQQGQVWCFVTWHLADSIPVEKLRQWTEEKQHWLWLHPEPWDEATTGEYHQRFTHHIETWLDKGVGSCLLKDTENAQIVSNALLHFNGERYDLATFVVMPNHVHVLFRPYEGHTITDILKSWKGFTAREINKRMKTQGTLWQAEFWDRLVRNEPHFHTYALYIRDNPEKAGLKDGFLLWQECGTECGHSCPPEAQCGQECPHSVPILDGIKTVAGHHSSTEAKE